MLVTTCRHCSARFRVTPEQLNLRQGQVRCGECEQVFNGFEALERFPGDDTGTRLLAARSSALKSADLVEDLEAVDLDEAYAAEPAQSALPEEPATSPAVDDAPPAPASGPEPGPASPEPPARPTPMSAMLPSSPSRADPREVPAYAPVQATRPSRAWPLGVVLLALVLGMQLAYAFRAKIAQQYPVARPALESACASIGCTVPWVNDESALKLEDSELLEVPGKPGQISLSARVRNLSGAAQEYPHLELTLTDVTGQTAVRRVLRPTDYLGRAPAPGEVMAPGSEILVSVRLETGRVKPTGYELLLFYPAAS
jgi:predicted Zn finger-like uncharacterized protein